MCHTTKLTPCPRGVSCISICLARRAEVEIKQRVDSCTSTLRKMFRSQMKEERAAIVAKAMADTLSTFGSSNTCHQPLPTHGSIVSMPTSTAHSTPTMPTMPTMSAMPVTPNVSTTSVLHEQPSQRSPPPPQPRAHDKSKEKTTAPAALPASYPVSLTYNSLDREKRKLITPVSATTSFCVQTLLVVAQAALSKDESKAAAIVTGDRCPGLLLAVAQDKHTVQMPASLNRLSLLPPLTPVHKKILPRCKIVAPPQQYVLLSSASTGSSAAVANTKPVTASLPPLQPLL